LRRKAQDLTELCPSFADFLLHAPWPEKPSGLLVFGNREIQATLDGLGFRFRVQRLLCALDLGWVQMKVLVGSLVQIVSGVYSP